jgi:hypothetical protein
MKKESYNVKWQRDRRNRIADIPDKNKVQCLICGRWYVQVCTHIVQVHKLTGRKYRIKFDLERKRGVIPAWYRKVKGDKALDNGTVKNLKSGKKYWFRPGDKTLGRYKRSHITIERVRNLCRKKLRKQKD